ncbi:MAG: sigma-54-dependent transcriptional regulator [Pseudobdellovibrionaceae bacterium]
MDENKIALNPKILIVDDNPSFLSEMKKILADNYDVATATNASAASVQLDNQAFDLVLLDFEMPNMTGLQFLKLIKRRFPDQTVVMLTGKSDSDTIISTMQAGAADFVIKGSEDFIASLKFRIAQNIEKISMLKQNQKLAAKVSTQNQKIEIVGASKVTMNLKSEILKLKGTQASVLITGENGTGKELIAKTLNAQEDDAARPFIAVNCAAITATLFESDLFGHVKGAFTGATENKIGKFKAADGGDIFLDEIGELSPELQAKLLRVLQERVITPVGSNKEIKIDVRVIAGTNRNLEEDIAQGRFREDLYHRINRIIIHSPSLRERKDDVLLLAEFFLHRHHPAAKFTEPAKKALINHKWIGNIRELENTIERAVIMARGSRRHFISLEHLSLSNSNPRPTKASVFVPNELLPKAESDITQNALQNCIDWIEKTFLERSLEILKDDNQAVYTKVGMSKASYFRRKKAIGLNADQEQNQEVML